MLKKSRLFFLIMMSVLLLVPSIPIRVAFASAAITQTGTNSGTSQTTLTVALTSVASGDIIIVAEYIGATCVAAGRSTTPADSFTSVFTQIDCEDDTTGSAKSVRTFYATPLGTGADTVSCNWTANANPDACYVFQVAGLTTAAPTSHYIANGGGVSGTASNVASFTPAAGSFILVMTGIRTAAGAFTAGTGYTLTTPNGVTVNGCGSCPQELGGEFSLAWGGGATTGTLNFPSQQWATAVAVWSTTVDSTQIVIGPCNYFQLNCWWYPMLFMLGFSGFFLMVAGVSKVDSKAAFHLFLTGLTFGAVLAVIFGIMNIVLPLILLLLNTLYVVRSKR